MMGGLGPGPFCGMLLGDLGADVIRVDPVTARPAAPTPPSLPGDHTHALLREMGFDSDAVTELVDAGVVAQSRRG